MDSKTETDVRQARVAVRDVRYKIQRRHKELNSDLNQKKKDYKAMAESLIERLLPTENNLDAKIKAVEAVAEATKAEKMAAEKIRLDAIREKIAGINTMADAAQTYGLTSVQIRECLSAIKDHPITEEIFSEFLEAATETHARAVETVTAFLNRTLLDEADAVARAEKDAELKAEAERLAKIAEEQEKARKEAEAAQAKADAEAKAERDAEAAKLAQEKAQIEADKAAIQAERDRMAAEAENVAFAERVRWCESIGAEWYAADWNEAHNANKEFDNKILIAKLKRWNEAIEINDQMNLGQAMADDIEAARLEELKPDKEKLLAFAETVGSLKIPDMKTDDGEIISSVVDSMLRDIVTFISDETGKF